MAYKRKTRKTRKQHRKLSRRNLGKGSSKGSMHLSELGSNSRSPGSKGSMHLSELGNNSRSPGSKGSMHLSELNKTRKHHK